MARPRLLLLPALLAAFFRSPAPALACGGLIGPNGAVNRLRTTTFAGCQSRTRRRVIPWPRRWRR